MINPWFRKQSFLTLLMLCVAVGAGCAGTQTTTKTETTVTSPIEETGNGGYLKTTPASSDQVTVEKTETTTTTESEGENPGVLSSTFHAIGYVLALPFIIIGGLFKIIFGG